MPTGYTEAIKNDITFQDYALACARAFGACVTMREEPTDTKIPDEFLVDEYYYSAVNEAHDNLANFLSLTSDEISELYEVHFTKQEEQYEKTRKDKQALEVKYLRMLAEVQDYVPPSHEHINFKKFMEDQIRQSIDWDCDMKYYDVPKRVPAMDWYKESLDYLQRAMDNREKSLEEEIERVNGRNLWIKQLKGSLK